MTNLFIEMGGSNFMLEFVPTDSSGNMHGKITWEGFAKGAKHILVVSPTISDGWQLRGSLVTFRISGFPVHSTIIIIILFFAYFALNDLLSVFLEGIGQGFSLVPSFPVCGTLDAIIYFALGKVKCKIRTEKRSAIY